MPDKHTDVTDLGRMTLEEIRGLPPEQLEALPDDALVDLDAVRLAAFLNHYRKVFHVGGAIWRTRQTARTRCRPFLRPRHLCAVLRVGDHGFLPGPFLLIQGGLWLVGVISALSLFFYAANRPFMSLWGVLVVLLLVFLLISVFSVLGDLAWHAYLRRHGLEKPAEGRR